MASDSLQVANGMVVAFDYVLTVSGGEEVDRSKSDAPVLYLHGARNIMPGLERALTGLAPGDAKRVMIRAADGYGEYDPANKQVVPRSAFPRGARIEEGDSFDMVDENTGEDITAFVDKVSGDQVVLDFNHPLAGENLFFTVKVVDVRHATREEIAHGHVH